MKRYRIFLLFVLALNVLFECACLNVIYAIDYPEPASVEKQIKDVKKVPDRRCSLIASLTAQLLVHEHYTGKKLDAALSGEVFDEYFRQLDPNRIFFLQSDIDSFQTQRDTLASSIVKGKLDFAFDVYNLYVKRLGEYRDYVHEYLKTEVKYNKDETFESERENTPWPVTDKERKKLWEERIKNTLILADLSDRASEKQAQKESSVKSDSEKNEKEDKDSGKSKRNATKSQLAPVPRIIKRADALYTTIAGVESIDVLEAYLRSFSAVFDPHTAYMSPATGDDFDIHVSLNLCGIGAVLSSVDGYVKVVEVVVGGPADKQGELQENDRIIEVQQEGGETVDVIDMPLNRVVSMIRGEDGTFVTLTVLPARQGAQASPTKIRIQRGKVPMSASKASGKLHTMKSPDGRELKIGVIDLPSFYEDFSAARRGGDDYNSSANDVKRIIMQQEGFKNADGLIIDLRSNGGGSLSDVVKIVGLFIPEGPVVQVKSRNEKDILDDEDGGFVAYSGPMIVMINQYSASASEIFAGAMKDYRRALIIGDPHSHGKGSVQVVQSLDKLMLFLAAEKFKAGEIKLTTSKFYRVNGNSTQLKGVASDIILPGMTLTEKSGERSLRYVLPWDTIESSDYKQYDGKYRVTDELIRKLKQASEKRIAENPEIQKLLALIREVEQIQNDKKVSLDPEKRWAEYERIQALEDELDTISRNRDLSGSEKKAAESRDDLNLNEALNIMVDYIETCAK